MGTGGTASVNYCKGKFSVSTDNFVFSSNDENLIKTEYIFRFLSANIDFVQKGFHGIGIQHLSKEYLGNLEIALVGIEEQSKLLNELKEIDKSKFILSFAYSKYFL